MALNNIPTEIRRPLTFFTVVLLSIWVAGLFFALRAASVGNCVEKTGQMGDTFGIVTSLVSCLALLAATLSSLLQMYQLNQERAKTRLEHQLSDLERIAFGFNDISRQAAETARKFWRPSNNSVDQTHFLRVSESDALELKTTYITALSKLKILVEAHSNDMAESLQALQKDVLKRFLPELVSQDYDKIRGALLRVQVTAEKGCNEAINLMRAVKQQTEL